MPKVSLETGVKYLEFIRHRIKSHTLEKAKVRNKQTMRDQWRIRLSKSEEEKTQLVIKTRDLSSSQRDIVSLKISHFKRVMFMKIQRNAHPLLLLTVISWHSLPAGVPGLYLPNLRCTYPSSQQPIPETYATETQTRECPWCPVGLWKHESWIGTTFPKTVGWLIHYSQSFITKCICGKLIY